MYLAHGLSANITASTYQKCSNEMACLSCYKLAYAHLMSSVSFSDFHVAMTYLLLEVQSDILHVCASRNEDMYCPRLCFRRGLFNASPSCHVKITIDFIMSPSPKNRTSIVPTCCGFLRLCCYDYISSLTKSDSSYACVCPRNRSGLRGMFLSPPETPKLSLRMAVYQKSHVLLRMRGHWERLAAAYKDQPSSRDLLSLS